MADSNEFIGQWVGQISGTNSGYLILNVDRDRPNCASVQADDPQQPFSAESVITVTGTTVNGTLSRFSPNGQPVPPELHLPQSGKFSGTIRDDRLIGTWETDIQTHGKFELTRREALIAPQPDHVMR
jgi:hypothetical protein